MRYIEIDEQQKNVPVFKNVIYALKITWKADKRLLLGYILQEGFFAIFSKYLQNILFLKILLASPKITSFKVQIFIISLFKDLLFI